MSRIRKKHSALAPFAVSFLLLILAGSLLLTLPVSGAGGLRIPYFKALFTSVSAVCVTGLSIINPAVELSPFGQAVLLLLIQLGGLGFMTVATSFLAFAGRRMSLRGRLVMQESLNSEGLGGIAMLLRWIVCSTLAVEGVGALLLAARFIPRYDIAKGMWYSLFHSISAFCNAGFTIFPDSDSLTAFQTDPLVNVVIMLLIITGGIGFAVLADVKRVKSFRRLMLQSKIVLIGTAILLTLGTVCTLLSEWNNPGTLGGMSVGKKLLSASFYSVTLRTAGFNTFAIAPISPALKLLSAVFMFIGASSASTGGGIKVNTVAVVLLDMLRTARGRTNLHLFHKRITRYAVDRSHVILSLALTILTAGSIVILSLAPGIDAIDLIFESASALGTVGLSSCGTGSLPLAAQALLMILMYIGRIGPLSIAILIAKRQDATAESVKYPSEHILLG